MKFLKFFSLMVALLIFSCASTKDSNEESSLSEPWMSLYNFHGQLSSKELGYVKYTYDWKSEEILYLFYYYDTRICGFDPKPLPTAPERIERSNKTRDFYFDYIKQESKRIVFVDKIEEVGIATNQLEDNFYWDKDEYLADRFFTKPDDCISIMVINSSGEYYQHSWHLSREQVFNYTEWLTGRAVAPKD